MYLSCLAISSPVTELSKANNLATTAESLGRRIARMMP